jgi:hypothetical protein
MARTTDIVACAAVALFALVAIVLGITHGDGE